jgi:hypothetical protein
MTNQDGKSFFELVPAEIRDQFYDATMFQNIQRKHLNFSFKAPCPHLRLVNHQFKDEYDERSIWGTTLEVSFRAAFTEYQRHPNTPGLAARCDSMRLKYLFQKNSHAREEDPPSLPHMCICLMLHLAPERVKHLEVCLVWFSVRMLKDHVSQQSDWLHRLINHLINDPYYLMHHEWWDGQHRDLSDSGIVVGLKLDYGGIPPLNTPMRLKCNALDDELLKRPITLGVWIGKDNCYLLDEDGISERLRLESLVEAAIQGNVKDQFSGDADIDIFEDSIWQEEVDVEVKHRDG